MDYCTTAYVTMPNNKPLKKNTKQYVTVGPGGNPKKEKKKQAKQLDRVFGNNTVELKMEEIDIDILLEKYLIS
jgi:hypothetical protein